MRKLCSTQVSVCVNWSDVGNNVLIRVTSRPNCQFDSCVKQLYFKRQWRHISGFQRKSSIFITKFLFLFLDTRLSRLSKLYRILCRLLTSHHDMQMANRCLPFVFILVWRPTTPSPPQVSVRLFIHSDQSRPNGGVVVLRLDSATPTLKRARTQICLSKYTFRGELYLLSTSWYEILHNVF